MVGLALPEWELSCDRILGATCFPHVVDVLVVNGLGLGWPSMRTGFFCLCFCVCVCLFFWRGGVGEGVGLAGFFIAICE